MWLIYFVQALQSNLTSNLAPYITSDFEGHSLLTVIATMTSIMSAACTMPVAKILNIWDRTVGFTLMMTIAMIGLIVMASCNDIATYCAARVFYSVGFTGVIFSVDVLTSDTSSMRNRGLAFAFTSSPNIITAFAGSPLANQFHESNWRWAYGTVAIILPVVATPLIVTWNLARRKAMENHVVKKTTSTRSWMEGFRYYFVEFDVIGIFLLIAGFSLLLLPLTLATSQPEQWRSASTITMIVLGGVLVLVFTIYERFFAPKPFIPYHLLANCTIIGACLMDMTYQIAYYCWNSYFTSYLQVVYETSLTEAGYINSIFDMVSAVWLFGVGFLMRYTGRFKWILLCAVPLYMLAVGLMIYFRSPGKSVGFIVMCEIFMSLGGGAIILLSQISVMAASKHEDYAAMLALLSLFGNMGGAVGNSISGAIWTNTLPGKLQEYLPESTKSKWYEIYESLDIQLSYPVGSATRDAIIHGYAVAQRNMLIAGTAIMGLSIVFVMMIKNIKLKNLDSMQGVVF
ncbi:hypothetical protein QQZ08_000122 [Neonectria magnoliae]|uniref:Major facilitator superfamily (MFS) profile domain-containing protein n=1 Tax=Neonectria magnoliae TaxID=2732573 RepID=A0ABR1IK25_9HYPO